MAISSVINHRFRFSKDQKRILFFLLHGVGRRNALVLLTIVCVMSVLDLVSIALIFPFLKIITDSSVASSAADKLMIWAGYSLPYPVLSHGEISFIFAVALVLFYSVKTIFQTGLMRAQARMLAKFTEDLTNNLISSLLKTRYAVFQQTPASEIAGTISVTNHATLALTAVMQVINESLLLTLMFFGFIFVQPLLAIGALFLGLLVAFLIYKIVIIRLAAIGKAQSKLENIRYRLLFSIASAIRDIKIMGLDALFDARNRHVCHDYAELAWRYSFYNMVPRVLIEFFALFGIVVIALVVVFSDAQINTAGPLLGLVALATVRAIPALSRLLSSTSIFRSSGPYVLLQIELREKLTGQAIYRKDDNLNFNHLIELKNIGFNYGDRRILHNICIDIKCGESIGIVGSSGSGKTTLLDIFTGLQEATEGQFFCDGTQFDPFTSHSIQKLIGYVPQAITLLDETISFNISFDENPDEARVMNVLDVANLHEFIASLPDGIHTRVGENGLRLSGGQRQRIGIARALYRSPEILVFDEATSSLDTLSELELTLEIEKLHGQISVVIVAHRLSTVISCDRIYVLSDGMIESSGTHYELLNKSNIYKKLYSSQYGDNCI